MTILAPTLILVALAVVTSILLTAISTLKETLMADQTTTQGKIDKLSGDVQTLGTALATIATGVQTEIATLTEANATLSRQLDAARAAVMSEDSTAINEALDAMDATILGYTNSVSSLISIVTPGPTPDAVAPAPDTGSSSS